MRPNSSLSVCLLFLTLLVACNQDLTSSEQAPTELAPLVFGTSGSDRATGLAKHSAGVYVVGSTDGNLHGTHRGGGDAFIRKYSSSGTVPWGKQFGTPGLEYYISVASDTNNNAYVVGTTNDSLAGSRGDEDAFIRRYNASGTVAWTQQFGSTAKDVARGAAAYGSNAVYVVGYTIGNLAGSSKGREDAFIRKYTASGSVAWTRQFGTSGYDEATDVAVDGSGNVYVVGSTTGALGGTPARGYDMFIRKYSPSGNVLWTRQEDYATDYGQAVAVSGSSVYLVGTYQQQPSASTDAWLVKYNTSGTFLWELVYGPDRYQYVRDATADSSGVVFSGQVLGSQGSLVGYTTKVDANGLRFFRWTKQQASNTDSTNAVLLRGSELYAADETYGALSGTNRGKLDAFIRRLNASGGATVWTDQ